jgi:hypothetical protein
MRGGRREGSGRPHNYQPCPCCAGTGRLMLTRMQFRIWDALRKAPHGLEASDLIDVAYSHRPDGGPASASQCVWGHVYHANKKLEAIGQRIVSTGGPGSVYRLEIYAVAPTTLGGHKESFRSGLTTEN